MQFLDIPPGEIHPNPSNKRGEFALEPLKASIAEVGLLQPLVVRRQYKVVVTQSSTERWYAAIPRAGGGGVNLQGSGHDSRAKAELEAGQLNEAVPYELVAGERRWRAVTDLKWETVPCVVLEAEEDQLNAKRGIAENYQRRDLEPLDEMAVFVNLVQDGLTVEDLAQVSGRSPAYIRGRLALASLSTEARDAIAEGKITIAHALVLCHAGTAQIQTNWLASILRGGYGYGEIMSAAQARRHFLDGWRHDEFAWPASFVEPCPACRDANQPSLFEEEKPEAKCFDLGHLKLTNERYVEAIKAWAEKKRIEIVVPQNNPWHLEHGKKKCTGLAPRVGKDVKRLIAWEEYKTGGSAVTKWIALTAADVETEKKNAKSGGIIGGSAALTRADRKPELPELRKRAAEKAATRHLLFTVHEVLEKKKSPPSILLAYALVKHADSQDRGKIFEAAGIQAIVYKPWAFLKAATEKQLQLVIRAAIEAALARENYGYGNEKIGVQASVARVLGIDPVASYAATEEDLKSMPREALVSALSEDLRGDSKHKKGELVKGAVGAKLDAGVASWVELRELLESPEPTASKHDDYHDDAEEIGADAEDDDEPDEDGE